MNDEPLSLVSGWRPLPLRALAKVRVFRLVVPAVVLIFAALLVPGFAPPAQAFKTAAHFVLLE